MIILGGSASNGIGASVAKELKAEYAEVAVRMFPDGEFKTTVPRDVKDADVVIVQSLYFPQERHLFELLFIADTVREMGAKSICAVIPYMAYARQNKRFDKGESASLETVLKMLNLVGITRLVLVDPHKKDSFSSFKGKVLFVSAVSSLLQNLKKHVGDPYLLAPDKGSLETTKGAAQMMNCEYGAMEKVRDPVTGAVEMKGGPKSGLSGKDVIILDDMISSGSTMVPACSFAYKMGARKVFLAATHLLMVDGAYEKLKKAGAVKILGANTIPCDNVEMVDVSKPIAEKLADL